MGEIVEARDGRRSSRLERGGEDRRRFKDDDGKGVEVGVRIGGRMRSRSMRGSGSVGSRC